MVGIGKCKEIEIKVSNEVKPWHLINWSEKGSSELAAQRMSICKTCELFRKKTKTCKICNCFMKAKTTLLNANCPIGKW